MISTGGPVLPGARGHVVVLESAEPTRSRAGSWLSAQAPNLLADPFELRRSLLTERPGTGCTRYDKAGDVVTIIDTSNGQTRAKIVKTVAGNAEKLAP